MPPRAAPAVVAPTMAAVQPRKRWVEVLIARQPAKRATGASHLPSFAQLELRMQGKQIVVKGAHPLEQPVAQETLGLQLNQLTLHHPKLRPQFTDAFLVRRGPHGVLPLHSLALSHPSPNCQLASILTRPRRPCHAGGLGPIQPG